MTGNTNEQGDIRAYLRPVLSRWWLILLVVPAVTAATYFYYDQKPKSYEASAEIFVQTSTLDQLLLGGEGSTDPASVENLALLLQTSAVGEEAARLLTKGKGKQAAANEDALSGSISATPIEKSNFIVVTATASTPAGAAQLANAYAKAFLATQARQLRGEASQTVVAAKKQLHELGPEKGSERTLLREKIQTLELITAQPASRTGIKLVEHAAPPVAPTGHDPTQNAIFAFVVSLMLAIAGAYGLEYLNRRITSIETIEELFELPTLTEIPKVDSPSPLNGSAVGMAKPLREPFHRLQANLDMLGHERPLRTILVASAAPNEGKSIVARNLGLAFREAGRNVAVFDADFRRPSLGGMFAAHEGPGLTDILAGRVSLGEAIQEVQVPVNGNGGVPSHALTVPGPAATTVGKGELAMVPAGAHTSDLPATLATGHLRETLAAAAGAYDVVIIDSAPLLATADVLPLLSEVDGVLLVSRLGVTTRDSARRLLTMIRRVPNAHLLGVVVNGIPSRIYRTRAYGYYYG